jgi:hypothetical protein
MPAGPAWLRLWGPAALLALLIAAGGLLAWRWPAVESPHPEPPVQPAHAMLPEASVADLLAGHASDWRVLRLQGRPDIVVIEFPGLAEQGATMNRIAALLEKSGAPRDRVLDNAALQRLIVANHDNAQTFYEGHDYRSAGLAHFFNLAHQQQLLLGPQEQRLLRQLLDIGLLVDAAPELRASGEQALITFSAVQLDDPRTSIDEGLDARRRESVLIHELSHGEFFTRPAYRAHCWRFWRERLTERERLQWRQLLVRLDYDPSNEELLVNETQALLMHTPDLRAFAGASLGVRETLLADQRRRFREGQTYGRNQR